jgi:hypothetical protein
VRVGRQSRLIPEQMWQRADRDMGKLTVGFVLFIVLLVLGGGIFLAVWNPPAPSAPVEKVIPNARFAR